MPIKILIADDHQMVAESLALMLETDDQIKIVGIVNNGWQALNFSIENEFDIILADYNMPMLNGKELAFKIKDLENSPKVIILTMSEDAEVIRESIIAGIHGFVLKSADKIELIKAIKTVSGGEKYFSENVVKKLAELKNENSINGKENISQIGVLTKREYEIISYLSKDLNNFEIAEILNISHTTVDTHRRNLMKKIGVNSAIGLMRWGLKNGILIENN